MAKSFYQRQKSLSRFRVGENSKEKTIFDVTKIRKDFPVLNQKIYGKHLIYFDNGATTQKPKGLDAIPYETTINTS